MYKFNIVEEKDGGWRFELDGINLILDGYSYRDGKHWIKNPDRAIAFFTLNGNMYSISNNIGQYATAEELYNSIRMQYVSFTKTNNTGNNLGSIRRSA